MSLLGNAVSLPCRCNTGGGDEIAPSREACFTEPMTSIPETGRIRWVLGWNKVDHVPLLGFPADLQQMNPLQSPSNRARTS